MSRVRLAVLGAALAFGAPGPPTWAEHRPKEWAVHGHDAGGMRFSPLKQIKPRNVDRLRLAWTFRTRERDVGLEAASPTHQAFQSTPHMVDGILYVTTPSSRLFALDAQTGRELWRLDPQGSSARRVFQPHRGV